LNVQAKRCLPIPRRIQYRHAAAEIRRVIHELAATRCWLDGNELLRQHPIGRFDICHKRRRVEKPGETVLLRWARH